MAVQVALSTFCLDESTNSCSLKKKLEVSSTTLQRISPPMEAGPEKAVLTFQPSASSR
jgi:hypothetical protein